MAGNSDLPFVTDLDGDNTRHRQAASTYCLCTGLVSMSIIVATVTARQINIMDSGLAD